MRIGNVSIRSSVLGSLVIAALCLTPAFAQTQNPNTCPTAQINSILGAGTTGNLFVFTDANIDANWQGASKGFQGNAVIDGVQANERTSGFVPYAGTITTNQAPLGAWQAIVDANKGQASTATNAPLVDQMQTNVTNAITTIVAMPVTTGFNTRSTASLNGLNTTNGVAETFVINVTSGFSVSSQINITGDKGDLFILRWDNDEDFTNGLNGEVKFQSGGAIVPLGDLTPGNFINIAGRIGSSGGGTNPAAPYPQGPRFGNGSGSLIAGGTDFAGGGFFTGYWLTTGIPTARGRAGAILTGPTGSLSNAIFVGGWYTATTQFSMTSGTSGVNVVCISLGPTAASASISGRISTDAGRAVSRASVTVTDAASGEVLGAISNTFGYFKLSGVEVGRVYILTVSHRQYVFENNPRVLTLIDNLSNVDFVAATPESPIANKTLTKTFQP